MELVIFSNKLAFLVRQKGDINFNWLTLLSVCSATIFLL